MIKTKETKKFDMTEGPMAKNIFLYAMPIAATAILQQLFNACDLAVVGRYVGDKAMAAVGSNAPIVNLVVNTFIGLALGASVIIATAKGAKDEETIHKTVHTSIILALILGVGAAIFGELFASPLLSLLRIPSEIFNMAKTYLRIYLIGIPMIVLYNFEASFFRSIGDSRTPLYILTLSGFLNIGLNILFVVVFKMTVEGVAIATAVSNAFSCIVLFIILLKTKTELKVSFNEFRIDKNSLKKILKIGLPSSIQAAVFSSANIIIQTAINSLGTIVIAASSASYNIELFVYFVLNSFGQTCTTYVGQNNGAKKQDRCKRAYGICFLEDLILTGLAITIIAFFGKTLIGVFNKNPEVISVGYQRMLIMFISYFFNFQFDLACGYLRGYGLTMIPSAITIFAIIGIRIFFVFAIFPSSPTLITIMSAYPISLGLAAIFTYIAILIVKPSKKFKLYSGKESLENAN